MCVDSKRLREFLLFVKQALTTFLTIIPNIDTLIASLPSESFPTTPHVSENDLQISDSLQTLRTLSEVFVSNGWGFFVEVTCKITDPAKSSFQTIILDDPSVPDLILNSIKFNHHNIRTQTLNAITNIIAEFPSMRENFMTVNLVGKIWFLAVIFRPIVDDKVTLFQQYRLIRVSVFEPAKQFITFIFNNSDNLVLDEEKKAQLEDTLCIMHNHIKNLELRSDEHEADFVSELVKWETRTMVELENEENLETLFDNIFNRTREWNRNKRERHKRRKVLLREEGWDDAIELRVVGIKADTNQEILEFSMEFAIEMAFNAVMFL
ncbi:hypothetical protein BLNAU_9711 [Blattamonas nauphoetae]|uniref:Uncharacterized protein n=1 Tax=Blattamonas nauphoetae TaxID=2049346 RepID=A0ABQ9XV14_9EUKA|nr:hypothetical protein BLNAU_9711 [Blattamonas nauphoetae]